MRGIQYALLAGLVIVVLISWIAATMLQSTAKFNLEDYSGIVPELGEEGDVQDMLESENNQVITETARFFTDEPNHWDLSEIACLISEDIYNDYSKNGNDGLRSDCSSDFIEYNKEGCFIKARKFLYGIKSSTFDKDEATFNDGDGEKYPFCRLCRTENAAGTMEGINNLDETCINYNLKYRTVGDLGFCNSSFPISSSGTARFGNCDDGSDDSFGNNIGKDGAKWYDFSDGPDIWDPFNSVNECGNDNNDFCDNERDMITWRADNSEGESWASEKWRVTDNSDDIGFIIGGTTGNSEILSDERNYMYGLYWVPHKNAYTLLFTMFPDQNPVAYSTKDWGDIWNKALKKDFYRSNQLGQRFFEARQVANFLVTPEVPLIPYGDLRGSIASAMQIDADTKIKFLPCDSSDCFSMPVEISDEDCSYSESNPLQYRDVVVRVFHTDTNGNAIKDSSIALPSGKTYRVIVTNWIAGFDGGGGGGTNCYNSYERTVLIIESATYTIKTSENNGKICIMEEGSETTSLDDKEICTGITPISYTISVGKKVSIKLVPDDSKYYANLQSTGGTIHSESPGVYITDEFAVKASGSMTASFTSTKQT